MNPLEAISLALGAAWGSGINLYASVLVLGLMQASGTIDLPAGLEILGHPLVIAVASIMYAVEFFADKIPGVDTAWDVFHTFVRIPAGAILAAQALGAVDPALALAAGLAGGSVAGVSHATKAGSRMIINTSPEPVSNWTASILEDLAVFAGVWAALQHPWVFLGFMVLFLLLVAYLLPRIWRGLRAIYRKARSFFGGAGAGGETAAGGAAPGASQTGANQQDPT